jgi:hypothetical protein
MFKKGDKKPENSGRKKGVRNKVTADVKELIGKVCDEAQLIATAQVLLQSKDERIRFDTLKLLLYYQFGKPVQPIVGAEDLPPVKIDLSAIPMSHERVN